MCMKNSVLEEKARRYLEIKKQSELLEAEKDKLKEELLKELTTRKKDKLTVGDITISQSVFTTTRVNAGLLKEGYPKVYEDCSYDSPSVRLTVK